MKRSFVSFTILSLLILLLPRGLSSISLVSAESQIWVVDDDGSGDFSTISEAISNSTPGDNIMVRSGTYFEHLNVSIPITLVGEDPLTTIIDGGGQRYLPIIFINSSDVVIKNFTIQNTASDFLVGGFGILVSETENVTVENNIFSRAYYSIELRNASDCRVLNNKLQKSYDSAIVLLTGSVNNKIIQNSLEDNPTGIWITDPTSNLNIFYRNNFVNNTNHAQLFGGPNTWDNGAEGNYWDNYQGTDSDGDGVGDTAHLGLDNYPLIEPWSSTRTYEVLSQEIILSCNYTVASFNFNQSLKTISFYVTGPSSSEGYCIVDIPKGLLNPSADERWLVKFGSNQPTFTNESVDDSNLVSFNFTLGSSMPENLASLKVERVSPTANFTYIPEYPTIDDLITFNGSESQPNGGIIVAYNWSFGDNSQPESGQTVNHEFDVAGTYNVTLTVEDSEGLTDSTFRTLEVNRITTMITFDAPESVSQNIAFTLVATLTDEIGDPVNDASIEFTLKNGSEWQLIGSAVTNHDGVASINYTAQNAGELFIKAEFIGDARYGTSSSEEHSLTVVAPASNITLYIIAATITTLGAGLLILASKRAKKSSGSSLNEQ